MLQSLRDVTVLILSLAVMSLISPASAQAAPSEIGVVVMHGKAGSPERHVDGLASELRQAGFQVANIEMPWSGNRHYDVDINGAVNEITAALDAMRAKGAKKLFVAGHSQGGLFALLYAGRQQVDGAIAIAPGGNHGAETYRNALGGQVGMAKGMIDAGRGNETERFADYEGSKGTYPVVASAAIYYDWFNPDGVHNTDYAASRVKGGTPVLYVAPTGDYPPLKKNRQANFNALPPHPQTRLYEPNSDHQGSPSAAAAEIVRWINQVAGQ
jgi:dienelactone hydrolase